MAVYRAGPLGELLMGIVLLVAGALNFRYSDWITRAMWGGKPDPEHARRMSESPIGRRIGGSVILALCGIASVVSGAANLLAGEIALYVPIHRTLDPAINGWMRGRSGGGILPAW